MQIHRTRDFGVRLFIFSSLFSYVMWTHGDVDRLTNTMTAKFLFVLYGTAVGKGES